MTPQCLSRSKPFPFPLMAADFLSCVCKQRFLTTRSRFPKTRVPHFFIRNMTHTNFHPILNTRHTFNKLRPLGIFPAAAEPNDMKSLKTDCVIPFLLISPILIEWARQDGVSFRTMCCRKKQRQASIRYSQFAWSLTDNWWNKSLCQAVKELKTKRKLCNRDVCTN